MLDPVIGPEVGPGVSTYVPAPGAQLGSDVAVASGGTALAVWRDARRGPYDVFATRVAPSGLSPLDSVGFLVSEPTSASVGSAAVAFGGGAFLVAWTHAGRVLVRRVATSGAFVDATPIVVREATGASSIDVVFDGTDFVLAWSEGATGSLDLFAARVTTDALVRDATPLVLSNAPGSQSGVRLASSAGTTHAVWTDTRTDTGDVYGAYIASGTVTDGGGDRDRHGVPGRAGDHGRRGDDARRLAGDRPRRRAPRGARPDGLAGRHAAHRSQRGRDGAEARELHDRPPHRVARGERHADYVRRDVDGDGGPAAAPSSSGARPAAAPSRSRTTGETTS
ncbi:MAG: hypothetical protein M5U28_02780 [Sandaracinaceae bacterium]|nr:hypothetical protein [Sandaracinaceae bacterium]